MPATAASRRPGPAVPLSEERILATAQGLLDETGPATFSMRALAARLEVSPMAIYNWFDNRDALLAALCARTVEAVALPTAEGTWEDRACAIARAFRDHFRRHYAVVMLARTSAVLETVMVQAADGGIRLMAEVGYHDADAVSALRALLWHAVGYALVVDADTDLPRPVAEITERTGAAVDTFASLLPHFAHFDRDHEFEFSVRMLVRGLAASAPRPPASPATTRPARRRTPKES